MPNKGEENKKNEQKVFKNLKKIEKYFLKNKIN